MIKDRAMRTGIHKTRHRLLIALAIVPVGVAATRAKADVYLPGDGTNTTVLNVADLPTGDQSRSFMAWIDLTPIELLNGGALAGYGSINPSSGYHRSAFDIDPSGQLDMQFQVGYVVSTGISLGTGTWTQIVGTYNSSDGVAIYVDGQPVTTIAGVNGFNPNAVDTININNNAVTFGYEYGVTAGSTDLNTTGLKLQGDIAADSIWDRVLTPAEVLADYDADGTLPDTNGLLAEVYGSVPASSSSVPEPASFALLSIGFAGLCAVRNRRGKHERPPARNDQKPRGAYGDPDKMNGGRTLARSWTRLRSATVHQKSASKKRS
jgi:hypothetical protein